ncbi:MAG: class I SAM-dependent methyltransferase [Candidatus Aquicultorales bacterium]
MEVSKAVDLHVKSPYLRLMLFNKEIPWPLDDVQKAKLEEFSQAIENGVIELQETDECPCGSKMLSQFASIDRFGLPFKSYLCEGCGLIISNPRIAPESLSLYYEEFYHPLHFGSVDYTKKPLFAAGQGAKAFNLIKDYLPEGENLEVLEVGAGSGSVLTEFMEAAKSSGYEGRAVGLEYDLESVKEFSDQQHDIKMIHGGIEALPPTGPRFNVVIMSHVLEHFVDTIGELNALRDKLSDAAVFFIEVPGILTLRQLYKYNCDYLRYFTNAHPYSFNLVSLTHLLNQLGLKLLWGNEAVESVFVYGQQTIDVKDNAKVVRTYLEDLETSLLFYQSLDPATRREHLGLVEDESYLRDLSSKTNELFSKNLALSERVAELTKELNALTIKAQRIEASLPFRAFKWVKHLLPSSSKDSRIMP